MSDMEILVQQIARQAWQPTLQTVHVQNPDGMGSTPTITALPSPLLSAVADELAHAIKDDPEIRAMLIEGLKAALLTPEWISALRGALPHIAIRQRESLRRAAVPDWVTEALGKHLAEWLDTDDSTEMVERMLSQSSITVNVERASAEPRR